MIKGDIDLTENMDFYHDKSNKSKKDLPSIPWNKQDKFKSSETSSSSYYTRDNTFSSYGYLYTNNISYYVDNIEYNELDFYTSDMSTNGDLYITFSYNIQYNSNQRTINYNTLDDYNFTTTYNNNIKSFYLGGGDIIDELENRFPWKERSKRRIISEKLISRRELTDNNSLRNSINCFDQFKRKKIRPFTETIDLSEEREKSTQSKRGIPWYDNLEDRIYKDYIRDLYEETDYSDYLTNRGWLGLST